MQSPGARLGSMDFSKARLGSKLDFQKYSRLGSARSSKVRARTGSKLEKLGLGQPLLLCLFFRNCRCFKQWLFDQKISILIFVVMASGLFSLVFVDFTDFHDITPMTNLKNDPVDKTSTTTESKATKSCFVRSTCQGHLLDHRKSYNQSSCLSHCQSNSKCQWATFDYFYHFCTLYSTCPSLGHKTCETCTTSFQDCTSEPMMDNFCNINGRCQVSIH